MVKKSKNTNVEDRVTALQATRLRLHRESPSRPIKSAAEAARFIKKRWVVVLMGGGSVAVLANAIAGRHLSGSWMAHPEAKLIYEIFLALEKFDFAGVRIIQGKWTLIDPLLGPAIMRIASDEERRARVITELPRPAAQLLERVVGEGSLMMESSGMTTKDGRKAREVLERNLLVESQSIHTEKGSHTVLLRPFESTGFARRFRPEALELTLPAAEEALVEACLHSAVLVPQSEANRWFDFARPCIEAMVSRGRIERLDAGERWLTLAGGSAQHS